MSATTRQLYEEAKLLLRGTFHEHTDSMLLACYYCGLVPPEESEMGMFDQHMQLSHPGKEARMRLVWIGEGPPPKSHA